MLWLSNRSNGTQRRPQWPDGPPLQSERGTVKCRNGLADGCALQEWRLRRHPPSAYNLLFLGRLFEVLDHRVELLVELLAVVTDAIQVGAEPGYALHSPTGFLDLLVIHST